LTINAGAATDLLDVDGGTVTVKGNTLSGGGYAFDHGGGSISAYANNITGYTNAYTGSGSENLRHNWWGNYSTAPAGLPSADWDARLGNLVSQWADGINSASLAMTGGTAQISGGTGTAVIVSHSKNYPPFDNGITQYIYSMCGEYLDFFVRDAAGVWSVAAPVDNNVTCNTNTRDLGRIYRINNVAECSTPDNAACWDRVTSGVSVNGQLLTVSGLQTSSLSGTQYVVGSSDGTDPTVVQIRSLSASGARNSWLPVGVLALSLVLGGAGFFLARWRRVGRAV
jgi:hypothetical protein